MTRDRCRPDGKEELFEPMLTLAQVAEIVGVSERHISNCVKRREFPPPVKLGRSVRFRPEDVRCWKNGEWST